MTCSLKLGRSSCSSHLLWHHSNLLLLCADQAGIQPHHDCWPQYEKLMHIWNLDPWLYTVNVLEELWGWIFYILHIYCIFCWTNISVIDKRFWSTEPPISRGPFVKLLRLLLPKQYPLHLATNLHKQWEMWVSCIFYKFYIYYIFLYFTYYIYITYSFHTFCNKSANSGDGCRWWYVNNWAPSNSGNKQWRPLEWLFHPENAHYAR